MGANDRILISISGGDISIDAPCAAHVAAGVPRLPQAAAAIPLPRAVWAPQGGTYCGLVVPRDGSKPYHLVAALVPEAKISPVRWGKTDKISHEFSDWDGNANMEALLAADPENHIANRIKSLTVGGFSDWIWPSKLDAALMYATVGDLVREFLGTWGMWICAQPPGFPCSAYVQFFDVGGQSWSHKDGEFGAVAVRRVYSVL
jgi:hypothetical protein